MALQDCIRKMGDRVTPEQRVALEQAKTDGLTDDQAVRRVALMAHQNVVDITLRAVDEGAALAPVANPVSDLAQFQARALQKLADKKTEVKAEISSFKERFSDISSLENHVRNMVLPNQEGGMIDLNNDQDVLDRMIQMTFQPHQRAGREGLGLTGESANEMLVSFRALQAEKSEIEGKFMDLSLELGRIDDQVNVIFSGTGEQTFYQLSPDVTKLMVSHNLSSENLIFTDNLGGLAVPSMAITPEGRPVTGFGEITLIGTEDLGDPTKMPLFDADGYTVRFPTAEHKPALARDLDPLIRTLYAYETLWEGKQSSLTYYVERHMKDHPNPQLVIWKMLESEAVRAQYLIEVHGQDLTPTEQDVRPQLSWGWDDDIIEFFTDKNNLEAANLAWESPKRQAMLQQAGKLAEQASMRSLMKRRKMTIDEAREATAFGALLNRDGSLSDSRFRILREDAIRKGTKELDKIANKNMLEKRLSDIDGGHEAFKAWVEAKVRPALGEARIKIGNKWEPYTLENIVRKMTGKLKGTEFMDNMMNEGLMRALAAHRFKNLEEMRRRADDTIGDADIVQRMRELAQGKMNLWTGEMAQFYTGEDANGYVVRFAFNRQVETID